jgi:radical SAM superfamily enzyme YgiQ (UPF0313 family)
MKGHDVRIVDNSFEKTYYLFRKQLEEFKPDIVAFSVIAGRDVLSVIPELKRIKCYKIAGGQGAAYNTEIFNDVQTLVFTDEAEKALPCFLGDGEFKKFSRINLDDSPIPRWSLTPPVKSRTFNTYVGAMEMSRGCPHHCDFCSIASFWHSLRVKSNDRIMEELRYLYDINKRHIYLADDCFGFDVQKHMALFDKILCSDIKIKWFTQIRADIVAKNPSMIRLAANAGLYGVLVGFDNYENDVLKENSKTTTTEINNECSRILRENKIAIVGSHIYGLPGQKSFDKTFNLGRKNSDIFAMPYFDGRPKIERPPYDQKYVDYVKKNQFSISELLGVFHPDKVIRVLKRGAWRRYFNCSIGYNKQRKLK